MVCIGRPRLGTNIIEDMIWNSFHQSHFVVWNQLETATPYARWSKNKNRASISDYLYNDTFYVFHPMSWDTGWPFLSRVPYYNFSLQMQNFVNFLVYCQNFAYHCMVKISRFQKKYRKWLIFTFSHSFSKDVSITHLHWEKSIKIVKSRRKNDIDYCKSHRKNVSLHRRNTRKCTR